MQPARSRPGRTWLAPGALLTVLVSVVASVGAGWAQETRPGRLLPSSDHAASLVREDGVRVIELTDNVRLVSEELYLEGDIGRLFQDINEVEVVGNVHLRTDSLRLWCDSLYVWQARNEGRAFGSVRIETEDGALGFGHWAIYLRDSNWLALIGNARVLDGQQMVAGDSIVIDRSAGIMESFGDVVVVDDENNATVRGRHAIFDQETGLGIVDSLPVLRMRQGDGPMMIVEADSMAFDQKGGSNTAIGNVDFRQGATRAHADTARIIEQDLLVLTGSPTVEQEGRVMSGREIRIWSEDGKVNHIEVYDAALLSDSTPDTLSLEFSDIPLANTLSGDTLEIDFDDGEIARTAVRGNAHSVYLPEDQASVVSVNDVRGESIEIHFSEGVVDVVYVQGGVQGVYRFFERRALVLPDSVTQDSLRAVAADTFDPGIATGDSLSATVDSLDTGSRVDFATSAEMVQYTGESTRFDVPDRRIDISGDSQVQHGTLRLLADEILFDTESRELLAEDENSVRLIDTDTELIGAKMGYLFEPKTGAVRDGATRFADGFYEGKNIRRVDKKTMLIERGTFTSCDLAEPHYHFKARKMKLKVGENVVARQVSMHISDIPIIVLPFYYKDLKSGRRSGILFPNVNIGVSSRDGRYIRDLGYYWATNEYTDFKFEMDYNERREATFKVENIYVKRYSFDGRFSFQYLRAFSADTTGDEWKFTSEHRQPELWDVWRASAKIDVSSKNVTRTNLSSNHNRDLIDSRLYSTAALSRSFSNGSALNFSFARTQFPNADDGDPIDNAQISEFNIPLGLTFKSGPIMRGVKRPGRNPAANFLRDFTFSHRYSGRYDQKRREAFESDGVSAQASLGMNWAPDKVGPIRISSSASFNDSWTYTQSELRGYEQVLDPDSNLVTVPDPGGDVFVDGSENTIRLNISNSASTDVYGSFAPRIGALRGIRHKMTAGTSWNLTPGIAGHQPRGQSFGFSLINELSLKILDQQRETAPGRREGDRAPGTAATAGTDAGRTDEPPEESVRKLDQFIVWNLRTSLNPEAESGEQWSNITSDVYLRPGITQAVSFSMAQEFDPYNFEVISTRFSSDLRLRGGLDLGGGVKVREEPLNPLLDQLEKPPVDSTAVGDLDPDDPRYDQEQQLKELEQWLEGGDRNVIPWEMYLRGSLTRRRDFDGETTVQTNMSTRASLSLPGQWKFSYSANFDVVTGEFTNQFWRLSRPLHCWKLEFNRGLADGDDFGISLYLNDIPDLRLDRGDRARQASFGSGLPAF
jgi:lipopolysaccharide assembly outer membrane protein LptD (OstA)